MSGHSHWSRIRHKKAVVDARRGRAWSKLARAVTMAAKAGGGNARARASTGGVPRHIRLAAI